MQDLIRTNRELSALVLELGEQLEACEDRHNPGALILGLLSGCVLLSILVWVARMTWMAKNPGLVFFFDR